MSAEHDVSSASHSVPSLVILQSDRPGWDKIVSKVKPAYEQRVASLKEMSLSTGDSEELHTKASPWQRKFPDLPVKLLRHGVGS